MAVITDVPIFWTNEECPDLYRIDCEYDDLEAGTTRRFSSITLNADPGTKIIGSEIPVYLDSPGRYLDYYVDVAYVLDPENWRPDM